MSAGVSFILSSQDVVTDSFITMSAGDMTQICGTLGASAVSFIDATNIEDDADAVLTQVFRSFASKSRPMQLPVLHHVLNIHRLLRKWLRITMRPRLRRIFSRDCMQLWSFVTITSV